MVSLWLAQTSRIVVIQKAIVKSIGVKCPKCNDGDVVERKSKKNRVFYGCSKYPECDFISWDKPIGRDCPKCNQYLVENKKGKTTQVICSNCDYKRQRRNNIFIS